MSTDLATTAPALPMMSSVTTDAMARLTEWVSAASQAHQLVAPLIESAFVPDNFKPRVAQNASEEDKDEARRVAIANGTSAVLLGLNLGLDPLTALQQIILIKNRPGMYAKAKVAILTARGYDIWTEELTDDKAVVCVVRPTTGGRVERFVVTMDMAKKAGWTSNDNYAKTPQDMLYARAAGRACDRTGAHILLGIPTAEDLPTAIEVEAAVGPRITITPADIIGTAEPAAAADQRSIEPAAQEPTPRKPSATDHSKMWARMKAHRLDSAELALEWLSQTVKRTVSSRDELTRDDMRVIGEALDQLDRDAQ